MNKLRLNWSYIAVTVAAVCLPAVFSGFPYAILICCFIMLYIIAVSGLDIVFGYCGQISMGHAAFFAIGAYGSALLHGYLGIPIPLTMAARFHRSGSRGSFDRVPGLKAGISFSVSGHIGLR